MTKETLKEFKERVRKEYETRYFDRQGNEIDLMDWAYKCEDMNYKILRQENIGRYFISTVWIGINMKIFRSAPKHIFETMIFLDKEKKDPDDPLYLYQERYSTEEEALLGHEVALSQCRKQLIDENKVKEL